MRKKNYTEIYFGLGYPKVEFCVTASLVRLRSKRKGAYIIKEIIYFIGFKKIGFARSDIKKTD